MGKKLLVAKVCAANDRATMSTWIITAILKELDRAALGNQAAGDE